jgi:hypothetical protein
MGVPKKTESWREALKFINRCPICGSNYKSEKAQLFAKNETANLIHLTCSKCRSYFIAMVLLVGQGLSSVGMVTDLSFEDITRLHKTNPFSTDDLIGGYESINNQYFLHSLIIKG